MQMSTSLSGALPRRGARAAHRTPPVDTRALRRRRQRPEVVSWYTGHAVAKLALAARRGAAMCRVRRRLQHSHNQRVNRAAAARATENAIRSKLQGRKMREWK